MMRGPDLPPGPQCSDGYDVRALILSIGLCAGLVISYLPQHLRIIRAGTSEGFSPWYLLLGATSSASAMLNLLIFTWPAMRCCEDVSGMSCLARLLGFAQVALQWFLFSLILILYLVYFPRHLKYQRVLPLGTPPTGYGALATEQTRTDPEDTTSIVEERINGYRRPVQTSIGTTPEWRLAVTLAWVVAIHLSLLTLLVLTPLVQQKASVVSLDQLAIFLGISGTILAVLQYAPQIYMTYNAGLIGALSLSTMAIQVPGTVLFVISIAVTPGTNWTSWIPFAVSGAMQAALLVICIAWHKRQKRLGVDDFGNPVLSDEHEPLMASE